MMYCSNCGKKLSEDDFFCSNCGTPVLRQNLFNDNDDEANEDAFEETRLFTAEELGQFLNDQPEEASSEPEEVYQAAPQSMNQYQAPLQQDYQDYQQDYIEEPFVAQEVVAEEPQSTAKKGVDAKVMVSGALGSANAAMGKFKARCQAAKAKKAEKKQLQNEETVATVEVTAEDNADAPIPLKKIILPVIVLGLIIGLVFGLILVQPWSNDNNDETATGTVMMVDSFEQQ